MSKKFFILLGIALALLAVVVWFRSGAAGGGILWQLSREGNLLLPLVVVAALVDSINPCAFSVLLLTVAFLFSIGKARAGILKIGVSYILGIFVVYILIGLGLLQALHLFNTPNFMAKAAAVLLITLGGINIINAYFPRFPLKLKIPSVSHARMAQLMEKASLPAAFFLGGLVGLCEFPCTGGPYLLILGLLHDQRTYLQGLGYLALYNLIFVLPLAVILLLSSESSLMEKVQAWKNTNAHKMRLYGGAVTIILGVLILLL